MIKIITSNQMDICFCGNITERKMIWIFGDDKIDKEIPLCCRCEKSLIVNLNNESKTNIGVEKIIVYDNGISEIKYKDGQSMLVNNLTYSQYYLIGWEDDDCFIKR